MRGGDTSVPLLRQARKCMTSITEADREVLRQTRDGVLDRIRTRRRETRPARNKQANKTKKKRLGNEQEKCTTGQHSHKQANITRTDNQMRKLTTFGRLFAVGQSLRWHYMSRVNRGRSDKSSEFERDSDGEKRVTEGERSWATKTDTHI